MRANNGAVDAVVAAVCHDLGQRHGNGFPDPGFTPASEPAIDRVPTAIFGRDIASRSAAAEPPQDAVDNRAVLLGTPASATVLGLDWQQTLQNAPFPLGEIASAQAYLQKAALNQPTAFASIASSSNRRQIYSMAKPIPTRFSVLPENEAAAIAHLEARGCSPAAIEKDDGRLSVLIFRPLPNDQMFRLVQALPVHLSAKIGIVMGDQPPFASKLDP